MYAINYSAHCPTNLNEKLISLYSGNVIGKGMKRVLVLRDTLTPHTVLHPRILNEVWKILL